METSKKQKDPMMPAPQKEHRWLQKLVGEWTFEGEAVMGPGQPPMKTSGIESVRSIGGLWIVAEGRGEMPGGGATTTIVQLGFDPLKKRYVGTWIGSMMTSLWVYNGVLDPTGKILPLETEGPAMTGEEKMGKYRDVIEIRSDDHRVLNSWMMGDDGKWHQFMTSHYRRKM